MALWYPKASRSAVAPVNGGSFVGGAHKGLLHTTEGSTASGAISSYRQSGFWPHFTASYEGGTFRIWQHIPINRAARALANLAGGAQTNRANVIQIELVGFATNPPSAPRYLAGIAEWMRWVEANFAVPRRSTVRFKAYPASYGRNNGVRLSASAWTGYGGWLGHMHAPENLHGDPGAINIQALLAGGEAPERDERDEDMALSDDDKRWITDTVAALIKKAMFARPAAGALTPVEALKLLAREQAASSDT
ncbi:MAG TPA: hypothetical protein VFA46_05400 [Actinomycetes bacterium]|jgi:hypothetical protein|nr:hypothetical protein [Actinomycetes bacterium]